MVKFEDPYPYTVMLRGLSKGFLLLIKVSFGAVGMVAQGERSELRSKFDAFGRFLIVKHLLSLMFVPHQ
jgi:hypothetical protein